MGYPSGPKLQLGGFLDQRIGLCILPLVKVNDGQLAQRRRIVRRQTQHLTIFFLRFIILFGSKSGVGARQEPVTMDFSDCRVGLRSPSASEDGSEHALLLDD